MPDYRIYYAEREVTARDRDRIFGGRGGSNVFDSEVMQETFWEEQIEARDPVQALEEFMREHVRDRTEVMWLDEDGRANPIEGIDEYYPGRSYIWIEDGKMMEFQGIDEATPGMVTCPLCDGHGEVDEEIAEEFESLSAESEGSSWG